VAHDFDPETLSQEGFGQQPERHYSLREALVGGRLERTHRDRDRRAGGQVTPYATGDAHSWHRAGIRQKTAESHRPPCQSFGDRGSRKLDAGRHPVGRSGSFRTLIIVADQPPQHWMASASEQDRRFDTSISPLGWVRIECCSRLSMSVMVEFLPASCPTHESPVAVAIFGARSLRSFLIFAEVLTIARRDDCIR
jgi:hypothetical protein